MSKFNQGRLEITTRIGCRIDCVYCPQKLLVNRYIETSQNDPIIEMSLDTFKQCIDKVPIDVRIDFSGMAEPWLNKHCTDMVEYAYQKGHPVAVYTTLIGMSEQDFDRLAQIPLQEFVLHIPDNKIKSHIDITPEYIKLLEKAIHTTYENQPMVTGYSCHAEIHPAILNAIPKDGKMITDLIDRAGNLSSDDVSHAVSQGEVVCVNCGTDMDHNVLLPDGRVVLCCMDYGLKHILGNLATQSWSEIHSGDEFQNIVNGLKNPACKILCRTCTNAKDATAIYQELALYRNWTQNLLQYQKQATIDLSKYSEWVKNLQETNHDYQLQMETMQNTIKKNEAWIADQQNTIANHQHTIKDYETWVANQQETIGDLKEFLRKEQELVQQREQQLKQEKQTNTALKQTIVEIHDSTSYKMAHSVAKAVSVFKKK